MAELATKRLDGSGAHAKRLAAALLSPLCPAPPLL